MKVEKALSVIIIIILFTTNLFSQKEIVSRNNDELFLSKDTKPSTLSAREVLIKIQDAGRVTQEVWQTWESAWENSTQYLYTYGSDYDQLIEFIAQSWESGDWINRYSYTYIYDTNGLLSGFNYYEWNNGNWDLEGIGTYSDYDINNNYGEETYMEQTKGGLEFKDRYTYVYDSNGKIIEYFSYYYDNPEWKPFDKYLHTYSGDCLISSISYTWDGTDYIVADKLDFSYDYGCNETIPYTDFWWLFDGSPSEWIYSVWESPEWKHVRRGEYEVNSCGWTTSGTMYSNYDATSMTWANSDAQGIITYNIKCGDTKTSSEIASDDVRAISALYQKKENNKWVNSQRTWISYENLPLSTNNESLEINNFTLAQNYPNPFNPNTNIDFSLSNESEVKLLIYDLTGKLIKELIDGKKVVGNYSVNWDGTNNDGNKVGAGVYLYKLRTDNFTLTRKMILLK